MASLLAARRAAPRALWTLALRWKVDAKGHIDRAMKATQAAAQGQEFDARDFEARRETSI